VDDEPLFLRKGRATARKRPRRWGKPVVLTLLAVVLLGGAARFLAGPLFSVRRFEISGNERSRTEEILGALEAWRGRNLVMLDLGPLAERLAREPWVERVTISKRFPDGLSIRIAERRPVALLKSEKDGKLVWLDAKGHAIALYDTRSEPGEYVVVSGDARSLPEIVGLIEDLREKRPEYFSSLSEIAVLPDGGFGMMESIFRRPIRVLRRDAVEKIGALLDARELIVRRGWEARAIDLRFADRIVLEGAYGAGNSL
jgi:cell division protein FtsQ